MEHEGGRGDLDVLAGLGGGQDTSGDTVRDAVLVHLLRQALDLVHVGGGGAITLDGVAVGIEFRLLVLGGAGAALLAELALGGLLGESLLLGGGRHVDGVLVVVLASGGGVLMEGLFAAGYVSTLLLGEVRLEE